MSNKVIAIVVGMVVVLGGVYFATRDSSSMVSPENSIAVGEQNPSTPTENTSGKKMSFDAFLKQGGSYVCTIKSGIPNDDVLIGGTVFINNKDLRGDFKASISGTQVTNSFISKGGYMYVWNSMTNGTGFKFVVNETSSTADGSMGFDANQVGDYDCQAWTVDSSKFALPSGVVFTEVKN
ncbi:MAG: hypothetical protein AB198_00350 [Parcubacteria bacterium C7867-003]|nr:MAG: hypothetical protein AB198_00350 [Parcubacteria bacterium C7867-003]